MPWELTIHASRDEPLGDRDTVVRLISASVPDICWIEEPSLLERIKDVPDHPFHSLIPTWPEETKAGVSRSRLLGNFEAAEFSIQLYGFGTQPISKIYVEARGEGNPLPFLAAVCKPNHWLAIDESVGQAIDLEAESAKGWELFRNYRDGAIRAIESSDEE